jgi:hypothetical protein
MGYYKRCTLVIEDHHEPEEVIKELRDENEWAEYAFEESGECSDEVKWYDCIDDMKGFSKRYPSLLFTIFFHGEDDQRWVCYFKNGEYQEGECKVTIEYEKFDENKLKK